MWVACADGKNSHPGNVAEAMAVRRLVTEAGAVPERQDVPGNVAVVARALLK